MANKEQPFESPGQHTYRGVLYPGHAKEEFLERIFQGDFQFRDDDVILQSFPKSGTTWMQYIIALMYHPEALENGGLDGYIEDYVPYMEVQKPGHKPGVDKLAECSTKKPRLMMTHMPCDMFYDKIANTPVKVISIARNPKDMVVSLMHFYKAHKGLGNFNGTWHGFFELFKQSGVTYNSPFDNILSWWNKREELNIHFMHYELLKKDTRNQLISLATFLGKSFTEDQLDKIIHLSSFDTMKRNDKTNMTQVKGIDTKVSPFMRKGQVGDWVNYFSEEQASYIDDQCKTRMEPAGFYFQDSS